MLIKGVIFAKWVYGVFPKFLVKIPVQRLLCKNIWHYPLATEIWFSKLPGLPLKNSGNMRPLDFCAHKSQDWI